MASFNADTVPGIQTGSSSVREKSGERVRKGGRERDGGRKEKRGMGEC